MRRKTKIRFLTYRQISKVAFFASWIKAVNVAKLSYGFCDKDDKLIALVGVWDDPQAHGEIVRWFDGRYYSRTYRDRVAKPYTMTLAKLKFLKNRLACTY